MSQDLETKRGRIFAPILPDWELTLLRSVAAGVDQFDVGATYRRVGRKWLDHSKLNRFAAVCLVVADLCDQGWKIVPVAGRFVLIPGDLGAGPDNDINDAKASVRAGLLIGRDRQLREPSVSKFIESMEKGSSSRKPISCLVTEGRDLLARLDAALGNESRDQEAAINAKSVIDPYVDFCDTESMCEFSGIRKLDIWRYFRHTWSLEYRSVPGRSFATLVRNRALPNHPVMGIALMASPVMKMRERDYWLGLSIESFEKKIAENPAIAGNALMDLQQTLDAAISNIRSCDLLEPDEVKLPTNNAILKLERIADGAKAAHEAQLKASETVIRGIDGDDLDAIDWSVASEDPLFVHKRAKVLSDLLSARRTLQTYSTGDDLLIGLLSKKGRKAVEITLRERLKTIISTQVMDLSVCGGVAPYSALTSGKLTALLMTSKEVLSTFEARYGGTPSVIASQMAGRPIRKDAKLYALTTTSLYGVGSSQYNRLKLRREDFPFLSSTIQFAEIAKTDGFGSIHLSSATVEALRNVSRDEYGVRRINSRFGEGTSPRMRQIREGLEALGINANAVLEHSSKRILYGCRLSENVAGRNSQDKIARAWLQRWAIKRLRRQKVRDQVSSEGPESIADLLRLDRNGQAELRFTA